MTKPTKTNEPTDQPNEGEGNHTAARRFNRDEQAFVRSGKVEKKAREAAKALDGDEKHELARAEHDGKRHVHEEDPAVKR
jgi:hypothetical protein